MEIAKQALKWGAILGISVVIATQILTWMGYGLTNWFIIATYLCVIAVTYFGVKHLKFHLPSQFSYLNIILLVFIMIVWSRYIFQTYMYIYIHFIDPDWIESVTVIWTDMLKEQGMETAKIDSQISRFHQAYEPLRMFTIEIIYIGLSQMVLGWIIGGVMKWLDGRRAKS